MDIYSYLGKEHSRLTGLLNALPEAATLDKRWQAFDMLKAELEAHFESKARTFYAALSGAVPELPDQDVAMMLHVLSRMDMDDLGWADKFAELRETVIGHFYSEESAVFDLARQQIDPQQAHHLMLEMEVMKQGLLGGDLLVMAPSDTENAVQ
ncbi:hemerythrin domain-containing protein [Asticcacaulis benevestitus]|uniref:Hemerythrin-like domain-containing protein n=1 Tax=Asticcacaulis benevestitus DSM 16100 = ATCC BAA-896 TaxID=1121022 RepID=V4P382_9CAUL|nr:hemerythrin domain-containing protein [Asticcacaulis benevestitus]ESQ81599.1 hypothetical protein ABENE_21750 [Asticcacaulis benevestitus DSM 16100 = ATCC BAA-896]